jgi:aubergine-like protein
MPEMILEHVNNYKQVMDHLPKSILFYRDGVGENQLPLIQDQEFEKTQQLLQKEFGIEKPKMTVIVVTKRTDEKFMMKDQRGAQNIPGGTIVGDTVTKTENINFFLQCQSVNMGTAKTPHYECIVNEMNLKPEEMQRISFDLSMLYYNWNAPVKVPSVCQEAHTLAYHEGVLDGSHGERNSTY